MNGTTDIRQQVVYALSELGAFDATCPGCGKGRAFGGAPRLPAYLTPQPGRRQTVAAVLACTRCAYPTEHLIGISWSNMPASQAA
ncbi:MAG: hypothetical protein ACR2JY_02770 [Chloroflexota bacterium]